MSTEAWSGNALQLLAPCHGTLQTWQAIHWKMMDFSVSLVLASPPNYITYIHWITEVFVIPQSNLMLKKNCFYFLSKLYAQYGTWTYNPKMKSHMLYWLSQWSTPKKLCLKWKYCTIKIHAHPCISLRVIIVLYN